VESTKAAVSNAQKGEVDRKGRARQDKPSNIKKAGVLGGRHPPSAQRDCRIRKGNHTARRKTILVGITPLTKNLTLNSPQVTTKPPDSDIKSVAVLTGGSYATGTPHFATA